ncbi:heavy metal translocating P-type ATPase [Acidimangrovimonas pyrenivorans]|uniref:P-type Zn(2+) transporter n=1 Tax=Acidimangrovimonas pyrenivorans TaxID=2030798 RepID=A0ABV7AMD8_9RHOB
MDPADDRSFPRALADALGRLVFPTVALLLAAGGVAHFAARPELTELLWIAGTVLALLAMLVDIAVHLRRGEFGLDLIAALAMAGALGLGEYLAGIIIAVMFTGGEALESYAQRRARRELTALLGRVPRSAARYRDGAIEEVPLEALAVGDRVLVRHGEIVPADGTVSGGGAVLDESALTGEALPVHRRDGQAVMSGSVNSGDPFDLEVSERAEQSTYAGIIRMVRAAQLAKAPMARLADRFALAFLPLTLAIAGGAWLVSGDPTRALAVLVVATPCPLILAVPVAIIAGVSRCASRGVLVKGGVALETLARVRTVMLDKTGTVTGGSARLVDLKVRDDQDPAEILRLAAALDQGSQHVVAEALVAAAHERGLALETPAETRETPGAGISGRIGARRVAVGGWDFVTADLPVSRFQDEIGSWIRKEGTVSVLVAVEGDLVGAFILADEVRPEAGTVLRQLRAAGAERIVLATGDRADIAENVGSFLGVDRVIAGMRPADKIANVEAEKRAHGPVMMVGDGVNDAPALAAADVGVAMGARGGAASSEAADVVIVLDRLDRVATAIGIARRSRSIALQSVYAGMGLSVTAMIVAAFGYLTPVEGAILQEAIDVAVILNALRALGPSVRTRFGRARMPSGELESLEEEHRELMDVLDAINAAAERARRIPGSELLLELEALETMLNERLLPHEVKDDREVYARIRRGTADADALAGMSRTHMEIHRMVRSLQTMREAIGGEPSEIERYELQRLLHGLAAITRLHFAQEEEIYRSLEAG